MADGEEKAKRRPAWRRTVWALAVVLLLLATASATFPTVWGPRVAQRMLLAVLPHGDGAENRLVVRRIRRSALDVEDVFLGGFPTAPSCKSAKVRFSLPGLREKRIDSIEATGLGLNLAYRVEHFAMPTLGGSGIRRVPDDPLQGWQIKRLDFETDGIDLEPILPPPAKALLPTPSCRATLRVEYAHGAYAGTIVGSVLGGPLRGTLDYNPATASGKLALHGEPSLRIKKAPDLGGVDAEADFRFSGTNGLVCTTDCSIGLRACSWKILATLVAGQGSFRARVRLPKTEIDEKEPLVATALAIAPLPDTLSALHLAGRVSGTVDVEASGGDPTWEARAEVEDFEGAANLGEIPASVTGGRSFVSAKGVGAFLRPAAIPIAFTNAAFGMISFGEGHALLMADDKSLMITEGDVGFCGGHVRLYALYLNFARLSTGFTVILDDLHAGEFIQQFPKLEGSVATGRLYGRLPLKIVNGSELRLSEGFLYSPPGETGTVSLAHPEVVTDLLAQSGVPAPVCKNLAKALTNLEYDTLRLDLHQPRMADGHLGIILKGKATEGKIVTPVNLNATVNGPIERILNMAIRTAKLKSGK